VVLVVRLSGLHPLQFANLARTWIKIADDLERTLAFVDALTRRPSRRGEPDRRALRLENKPPDDEGWGGGDILARYEHGVMLFLLILTVTILAPTRLAGGYNKGTPAETDARFC
jgi:hypothetical protein